MSRHAVQAAERFDQWASTYGEDRMTRWFHHYQTVALSELDLEGGPGFLEVGCGTGWAVRQAAKRIPSGFACGIDISPLMIEKAASQLDNSENVEFQVASSESLPFGNETFQSILCSNSFHHYENPVRALREIKRVLKPDGRFVLLDSARDVSLGVWLQDRIHRCFEKSHVRYYTTNEMAQLLGDADWKFVGELLTIKKFMHHHKVFTGLMLAVCKKESDTSLHRTSDDINRAAVAVLEREPDRN